MHVRFVDADGAHLRESEDVIEIYAHDDGFFWIDIPEWNDEADATSRTSMICSVAYATDDSGSDDRIGSARSLGSVECSAC